MVVGLHEAARRNECRRTSARTCEADRRQAHVIEPSLVGPKTIGLLDLVGREIVEGPHALVSMAGGAQGQQQYGGSSSSENHAITICTVKPPSYPDWMTGQAGGTFAVEPPLT
jgi:hypothetical protein